MMRRIVYSRPDGGVSIVRPCEGNRLAHSITLADGTKMAENIAVPADSFMREWPVEGATAEWAETEDEFLSRVMERSVPVDAKDVHLIEPEDIPADRTSRNSWALDGGKIVVLS